MFVVKFITVCLCVLFYNVELVSLNDYVYTKNEKKVIVDNSDFYPKYTGPVTIMDPTVEELLQTPINLEKCEGLQIIEWRNSVGKEATTSPNDKSIYVLNKICSLVYSKFDIFIRSREKTVKNHEKFSWFLCLIPGSPSFGGRDPRNLNDDLGRFIARPKIHKSYYYGGWTAHQRKKSFIGNDILADDGSINNKTVVIFAHELFHAMSWHYGVFENTEEDEKLAREFTEYIGLVY